VCSVSDNGPCLGWRESINKPYQWLNYNEALLRAKNFGSGLVAVGLSPSPSTYIGIYSQNCPEWILTEQGAYCYSMVIVPLYDTLGPDACAYIIKQGMENESSYIVRMVFQGRNSQCGAHSVLSCSIQKWH
jgi:long-chain acyl-CoA synthetase